MSSTKTKTARPAKYAAPPEDLTIAKIRAGIPRDLFKQNTTKSLMYMMRDLGQVVVFHLAMSHIVAPWLQTTALTGMAGFALNFVVWNVFWFFQGLNFTALWVLAHEAGHGGFSDSATVNELVGFVLHTALLVPYHSWRVSHATHHKYTNHLTMDTVFVPDGLPQPLTEAIEESPVVSLAKFIGMVTLGWPFYLAVNIAGQNFGRRTNHFEPSSPLFKKGDRWGVLVSNVGLLGVLAVIGVAIKHVGWWTVLAYYGMPYLWTNAWLVYITFMHHHDARIPHYTDANFNFVRGALCSIDRDYGFVNAWLHHINDSHVVHHLFHDMPWYNAIEVTRKYIKPLVGEYYASDSRSMLTQTIESWRQCLYVVPSEGISYFRN
jgi:omega-6 fatty acid desaturase (delta-12 desaturase)